MLAHVVKVQVLDLVVGRVDLLVGVFHLGFDCHGRRVALSASRGVVRAGVAAFGFDKRDIAVLPGQYCAQVK